MEHPGELSVPAKTRRRHSSQFKAQVLSEIAQPGISIAAVARRHNLNANLIHKWRKQLATPAFMPLTLPTPGNPVPSTVAEDAIRIEVPRAGGPITVTWPVSDADRAVSLLRELLL